MTIKRCPICGCRMTPSRRTKDHLIPKSKGGDGGYLNTWTICKRCNNAKGDRLPTESEILAFCRIKAIPFGLYEPLTAEEPTHDAG